MIELISNCDAAGTEGLVLSIDYSKAFDTLSINFMKECYKFFGFGDYFIIMLDNFTLECLERILLNFLFYCFEMGFLFGYGNHEPTIFGLIVFVSFVFVSNNLCY